MNPKRLGFQAFDVHFGMFDYSVHVIVGPFANVEKYVRWKIDDPKLDLSGASPRGMHFGRRGWVPVLWIPRRPRTAREHGTVAHEALHCVRFMFQTWVGMPFDYDTDEAYCHAVGFLVTSILERVK